MPRWALGRFDDGFDQFVGVVAGDRVIRTGEDSVRAVLDDWPAAHRRLDTLAREATGGDVLADLRVLAPVEPRQIFQAGANYRSHVAEIIVSGRAPDDRRSDEELRRAAEQMMDDRARSGSPFLFSGLPAAICGPGDDVLLPPESEQVDWEAELAVVIGATARRVPREQAMEYVACYTICNDVSARDLQFSAEHRPLGGDWVRAKNRPTFLPTGPFLVPADQVADYRDREITFALNGERRQHDVPGNMLFDVPALIAAASSATTLFPGDLILTGSPAGNGGHWQRWLRPGDRMEASIAGLGTLRNTCVREEP